MAHTQLFLIFSYYYRPTLAVDLAIKSPLRMCLPKSDLLLLPARLLKIVDC